jgi:hypothetical protein
VRATDLRQVKVSEDDFGLLSYDPALLNTASCRSAITFIDGDRGVLRYHPQHETSNEPATAPEHSDNRFFGFQRGRIVASRAQLGLPA